MSSPMLILHIPPRHMETNRNPLHYLHHSIMLILYGNICDQLASNIQALRILESEQNSRDPDGHDEKIAHTRKLIEILKQTRDLIEGVL